MSISYIYFQWWGQPCLWITVRQMGAAKTKSNETLSRSLKFQIYFTVLWITACLQLFVWGRNSKEYFSFYFVHNTHLCTVGKQSFGRFAMCYAQFEITRLEPNYRSKWLQRNDEIRMLVKDGVCARVLCARVCVYMTQRYMQ